MRSRQHVYSNSKKEFQIFTNSNFFEEIVICFMVKYLFSAMHRFLHKQFFFINIYSVHHNHPINFKILYKKIELQYF